MPIQVICPGCHARFTVSDKFAGQTGPCPKCKEQIQIPEKGDEVVIHAPELEAGAKDAKGRSVLKPIKRKEANFSWVITAGIIGCVLVSLAIAFVMRVSYPEGVPFFVLALGASVLGPPLAYAGYTFLRDDEKGYYQGVDVLIRSVLCGLVYALLWGAYVWIGYQLFDFEEGLNIGQAAGLVIAMCIAGAGTAFVSFDLEIGSGFFNYVLYLLVTIGLRCVMGLGFLPGF